MATTVKEPIWHRGGVFQAASEARKQGRLLVVCVLDEGLVHGAKHHKQLYDALNNTEVASLLAAHCICVKLAAPSEEENAFTRLFPAAQALSICIAHSAGNVVVCGPNVTQTRIAGEIQTQLGASKQSQGSVHMGSLEAIENERLRRLLVSRRRGDMQRVKQAVSDFRDDRIGYEYVHGPTKPAAPTRTEESASEGRAGSKAHLLLRVSNGRTLTAEFDALAAFSEVRAHVAKELGPAGIATMLPPRRVLGDEDDARTLVALGLVPTATLLVQVAATAQAQKMAEPWFEWPAPHRLRQLAYLGVVGILLLACMFPRK